MRSRRNVRLLLLLLAVAAVAVLVVVRPSLWRGSEERTMSGAYEALNVWAAQRAYPNPVVPDVGYALAYEELMRMRSRDGGVDDVIDPWETMGPANIGGRIQDIEGLCHTRFDIGRHQRLRWYGAVWRIRNDP